MDSPSINSGERKRRTRAMLIGVVLLLAALAPIIVYRWRSTPSATSLIAEAPPPEAPAVEVHRGTLKKKLLLDGELRAVRSRTIYGSTPDDVKIAYLPPEGTIVKAGDRLVELDSSTVLAKIKENEEKIVAAENEIVRVRAQHEGLLRDLEVELSKLWLA
ncbi:MAG TPA: hypothetical protein VJ302_07300, partial [Blastocatellia bacterium]|nr:hypothetical protein [Blastocatellia bacterium]